MFSMRNKKKISLNYPQYPLLPGALISSVTGLLHNRIMAPNIQEYLSLSVEPNGAPTAVSELSFIFGKNDVNVFLGIHQKVQRNN